MMNKQTFVSFSLIAMTLLFSACGSSPTAKIYILSAMDRAAIMPTGQNIVVKVGPVTIPDMLDQSQIITRTGQNSLVADEFNVWSGDFQEDVQRIIGENISILVPTNQVVLNQEVSLVAYDYQVMINIRELDGSLGGEVTLNADWTVSDAAKRKKDKVVIAKKSVLKETTQGANYQAYVAAQSHLLAKLSAEISTEIKRLATAARAQ